MILWLKFSAESSLPERLSRQEQDRLEKIFDAGNGESVWHRAAGRLGLKCADKAILKWHLDSPYVNWSAIVDMVSCGWVEVVPQGENGFSYKVRYRFSRLPELIRCQWRIARYVEGRLLKGAVIPETTGERLCESTALGIALLALTLRLPRHDPADLAAWLADGNMAPPALRRTVMQMRAIQERRTLLSSAWRELFLPRPAAPAAGPDFFWNHPSDFSVDAQKMQSPHQNEWKGLPVSAGRVTGRVVLNPRVPTEKDGPLVLVFSFARPETTEFFPFADAVLYGGGGALSHACTVAREQNIPCITGLGEGFIFTLAEGIKNGDSVWLCVDGERGDVQRIDIDH